MGRFSARLSRQREHLNVLREGSLASASQMNSLTGDGVAAARAARGVAGLDGRTQAALHATGVDGDARDGRVEVAQVGWAQHDLRDQAGQGRGLDGERAAQARRWRCGSPSRRGRAARARRRRPWCVTRSRRRARPGQAPAPGARVRAGADRGPGVLGGFCGSAIVLAQSIRGRRTGSAAPGIASRRHQLRRSPRSEVVAIRAG